MQPHRLLANSLLTLGAAVACLSVALAQQADAPGRPTADEIVKKLTAPATTRSISRSISVEGRRQNAEPPPSIDLDINFDTASVRLNADARIVLDNLGKALGDPELKRSRFTVAGHTDAAGSDAHNLSLSRQRARAVANYLVQQYAIEPARLEVQGYGRARLLDAANPLSGVNRRVQIVNLGSVQKNAAH